jgi:putative endonuclease
MANANRRIYTGVTNNLIRRVFQHKSKSIPGFTSRYNIDKLVYYEMTNDIYTALGREKQIKGWLRIKKIKLIETMNPGWVDLAKEWIGL